MSEETISDRLRRMSLRQPEMRDDLTRPQVFSILCYLKLTKDTAERMFKNVEFEPDEEMITVREVLRPSLPGEPGVLFHTGSGTNFCVDHYELENGDRIEL